MDHEDPTLDVEAALRDEEELAALAELGAAWTAPEEEPSATPPGDAAATPGEPGSDAEKAPSGPPFSGEVRGDPALRTENITSGPRASALWMSPVCVVASGRGGGAGARQRSCRRGLLGVSAEGDPAPGRL